MFIDHMDQLFHKAIYGEDLYGGVSPMSKHSGVSVYRTMCEKVLLLLWCKIGLESIVGPVC